MQAGESSSVVEVQPPMEVLHSPSGLDRLVGFDSLDFAVVGALAVQPGPEFVCEGRRDGRFDEDDFLLDRRRRRSQLFGSLDDGQLVGERSLRDRRIRQDQQGDDEVHLAPPLK